MPDRIALMEPRPVYSGSSNLLIQGAALVVIIAGLKAAAPVLVPFLLAVLAAFLAMPPLLWLQSRGLSRWLSLALIILVGLMLDVLIVVFFGTTLKEFGQGYPVYVQRLQEDTAHLEDWLNSQGITVPPDFFDRAMEVFDPSAIMQLVGGLFTSVGNVLTNAFFIFLTTVFILIEVPSFPAKLRRIGSHPEQTLDRVHLFGQNLMRYLAIKTTISLITGILIGVWLAFIDVDFAILWGMLAFLFNFVPNIGSIIAAIPAVLLALIQGGLQMALLAAGGFLIVNVVMGNILEPRVMGYGLGLSTLAVFLSLVFWGWIFGPVGMLLSVPLTLLLKAVLQSRPETEWIAILLGPGEAENVDPDEGATP